MTVIKPSNAINAKAMAKYGHRIREKDYENMSRFTHISEVVLYLKNNTYYSKYLDRINETSIRRGELESIIRGKIFQDMMDLCKYDFSAGNPVSSMLRRMMEQRELSSFLYYLSTGRSDEYYLTYPSYLDKYVSIDLKTISLSKNYQEFLISIKDTEYFKFLKKFEPKENGEIDIPAIEDALDRYTIDRIHKELVKNSGGRKSEIEELYKYICDFTNVQRIHRLKKYYDLTPAEILSHLRGQGTISEKKLLMMCECEDPADIIKIYATTKSGKKQNKKIYNSSREFYLRSVFYYAENRLHFSQNTEVILICYLLLCQNELFNIINIIEGVRYGLPPEEIKSILIYQ